MVCNELSNVLDQFRRVYRSQQAFGGLKLNVFFVNSF